MHESKLPILYSFRRCPYAMRARLALLASGKSCELREVVLRNKPAEMIAASPKATVPVWIDTDGTVRDESLEIMQWALGENDPQDWLTPPSGTEQDMHSLIDRIDGPFKHHLDRYKYATRYTDENGGAGVDPDHHRDAALAILDDFETRLSKHSCLFGDRPCLADMATAPFIRQYANTNRKWFDAQPIPHVQAWLDRFLTSDLFAAIMEKYPPWQSGTKGIEFG